VLLAAAAWRALQALGPGAPADPVFRSRAGGHLSPVQVWRIVRKAARDAGIPADVSPHWLRHAHASHALGRQAPIHLVQQTLGHASLATTSKYAHARPGDSSGRYLGLGEL
jgi:site-specific recombinase XerD